jgi:hypothetical protein
MESTPATDNVLHLTILDDNNRPARNVQIWKKYGENQLTRSDNQGQCDIVKPAHDESLELFTRKEGMADCSLSWIPKNGDVIPNNYTVHLFRAASIGGIVLGPDDQPVEGAQVGFNHNADPKARTLPENHEFSWIQVRTESDGRWSINRIASDMIHRIYGSARHTNFSSSALVEAGGDPEVLRQLMEGTHIFRLGSAATVSGVVLDSDGRPVVGANVAMGQVGHPDKRETTSLADGTFVIGGCTLGKNTLTAEARGFSATSMQVEVSSNSPPYKIVMQSGNILRLRVVDLSGQPVPDANVWLNTFSRRSDPESSLPQVEFNRQTDREGRVTWEDAPKRELDFDIAAKGHMRLNNLTLTPDGQEHTVTLANALVIAGTVRDASTRQLVSQFSLVCGCPNDSFQVVDGKAHFQALEGGANARWSGLDRFTVHFSQGAFRHSLEEGVISDHTNYVFKITADGYAPWVSRVVRANEGEVKFDVQLKATTNSLVRVVLPDGRPAALADVGLATAVSSLRLIPGGFSRENSANNAYLLRADDDGCFRFPTGEVINRVSTVVLQPWGRVEVILANGAPPAPREFILAYKDLGYQVISFSSTYHIKNDAQGKFIWTQAPPGQLRLDEMVTGLATLPSQPNAKIWSHVPLTNEVIVLPGQTTTLTL